MIGSIRFFSLFHGCILNMPRHPLKTSLTFRYAQVRDIGVTELWAKNSEYSRPGKINKFIKMISAQQRHNNSAYDDDDDVEEIDKGCLGWGSSGGLFINLFVERRKNWIWCLNLNANNIVSRIRQNMTIETEEPPSLWCLVLMSWVTIVDCGGVWIDACCAQK